MRDADRGAVCNAGKMVVKAAVITAGALAFLLLMTTDVIVAVATNDYWGVACLPAGAVIGLGIGWATTRKQHGR